MTTIYWCKKLNQLIAILLLCTLSLFATEVETTPPLPVKTLCLECHFISSLNISGGSSGGDLSKIMKQAKEHGSFESYIESKYDTTGEIFFLYPSKYVPPMALVEGKLFTNDIQKVLIFLDTIPPEPKFVMRWYHYLLLLIVSLIVAIYLKRRRVS